jgi:hypothetical protein
MDKKGIYLGFYAENECKNRDLYFVVFLANWRD